MKIGIITIQKSSTSYGGILQSFALWKFLQKEGNDVEIIDLYRPFRKEYCNKTDSISFHTYHHRKQYFSRPSLKQILNPRYWYVEWMKKLKTKKLYSFAEKAKYSRPYYSVDSLYSDMPLYDVYVSGSDQIWNPDMKFELAPYFLDFVKSGKKIAYASSFGKTNLSNDMIKQIKKWLSDYYAIGVREDSGRNIVKSIGLSSTVVLDPTFLLSANDWLEFAKKPTSGKRHVVIFLLYADKQSIDIVKAIAQVNDWEIYVNANVKGCTDISYVGVEEWLGYISNAELIVTDSFHASVFSILFKRNFFSLITSSSNSLSRSSRLVDLLQSLQLSSRLLNSKGLDFINIEKSIDYSKVTPLLQDRINKSREFLNHAINCNYEK